MRGRICNPPSPPSRQRRIDRQIQRQRHHCDISKPDWHRRLKGEGDRNPLIAEGKMPDAEQPADNECAFSARGVRDQMDQQSKADERHRPKPPRLEPESRNPTCDQCDPAWMVLKQSGDFLHGAVFARAI
jgi:hypothetical protein